MKISILIVVGLLTLIPLQAEALDEEWMKNVDSVAPKVCEKFKDDIVRAYDFDALLSASIIGGVIVVEIVDGATEADSHDNLWDSDRIRDTIFYIRDLRDDPKFGTITQAIVAYKMWPASEHGISYEDAYDSVYTKKVRYAARYC